MATLSVRRAFKPPPLQPFGKGPSLGLRPVGASRNILIEAALLERANNAHEATLQTVRCCLAGCEVECFQSPLIDLACVLSHGPQIFEVKSISAENEVEQVRAANAQLSDYRFRYQNEEPFIGREVGLWVALSKTPSEDWTISFLRLAGICLIWLEGSNSLAGPDFSILSPPALLGSGENEISRKSLIPARVAESDNE